MSRRGWHPPPRRASGEVGAEHLERLCPGGIDLGAGLHVGGLGRRGFAGEVAIDELPIQGFGHWCPVGVVEWDNRAGKNPTRWIQGVKSATNGHSRDWRV